MTLEHSYLRRGLGAGLAVALLSNQSAAYDHIGHQRITDTAWQVMVAAKDPAPIEQTFETLTPLSLTAVPPGASAAEWALFLSQVADAVDKIPKARSGLDQTPTNPSLCNELYPPGGIDQCRSAELHFAPDPDWIRGDNNICHADHTYHPGGIYDALNSGFTGMHLGRLAVLPDDDYDEAALWHRLHTMALMGNVLSAVSDAQQFGLALLVAPFVCAAALLSGRNCFDDVSDVADDLDFVDMAVGTIPGIGEYRQFPIVDKDIMGFWHFLHVEAPGGEYNDTMGLDYDFAGPSGSVGGVIDSAFSIGSDLMGLGLKVSASAGVRRYELTEDEVQTPSPSAYRPTYRWQASNVGHVEMNPLDNFAEWGWQQFEEDPSNLAMLARPLHALGDVTVPMHVVGTSSFGHVPFETAVGEFFPELLHQSSTSGSESTDEERMVQLEQTRRILLDGFRWWQWIREFRQANPEWGPMPIRPFITAIAHETAEKGRPLLIDSASFLDAMSTPIGFLTDAAEGTVNLAVDITNVAANQAVDTFNSRTGANLAPVSISSDVDLSVGNVYHRLLPLLSERIEASAAAKVAFLTLVGHEFVEPPPPQVQTPCNEIVPLCPTGFGVDPATRTCVECSSDVVIDWANVGCFGTTTVPISSQSSTSDTCPDQFWVEVRNLTSRPNDVFGATALLQSVPEPTCGGTKVAIGIYERQLNGGHTEQDTSNSLASYSSGCAGNCAEGCFAQDGASLPISFLDTGDIVRVWTVIDPDVGAGAAQLQLSTGTHCVIHLPPE